MQPLIKWPGGKSSEIDQIKNIIPLKFNKYIEPFCGGAAVYFYLEPSSAIINDISKNLTGFYSLIKTGDTTFKTLMYELNSIWENLKLSSLIIVNDLEKLFLSCRNRKFSENEIKTFLQIHTNKILNNIKSELINKNILNKEINRTICDKFFRTLKNEKKYEKSLTEEDLKENLLTGILSGFYMTIRTQFNELEKCRTLSNKDFIKKITLFYFIREFCYGSMFRYNKKGEFNIPYGGIAYNSKDYQKKINTIFDKKTYELFKNTTIKNEDFESILMESTENDFIFLDPPYDTDFSDYENKSFNRDSQIRLEKALEKISSKFLLVIKNTPFIYKLYNKNYFKINSFDNHYSYCVKNRNDRKVEHLIITNY